jgi:hypothetical protein
MPVNAKLILPAKLEAVTFPIEGRALYSGEESALFSGAWDVVKLFSGDADDAWSRLKKRNEAQFAEINRLFSNFERTDA